MPNYKKTLKQAETDYIRKTAERQAILKIIHQRTLEIEYDSGIALGAATGYDFGSARIEGELAYQQKGRRIFSAPFFIYKKRLF
ncbi:MAG: hypothetical protein JRJ44_09475 [Deltaproteobacteria bacterium]|nr:hypothetical protein [Deltaproteobacteria bacterium]